MPEKKSTPLPEDTGGMPPPLPWERKAPQSPEAPREPESQTTSDNQTGTKNNSASTIPLPQVGQSSVAAPFPRGNGILPPPFLVERSPIHIADGLSTSPPPLVLMPTPAKPSGGGVSREVVLPALPNTGSARLAEIIKKGQKIERKLPSGSAIVIPEPKTVQAPKPVLAKPTNHSRELKQSQDPKPERPSMDEAQKIRTLTKSEADVPLKLPMIKAPVRANSATEPDPFNLMVLTMLAFILPIVTLLLNLFMPSLLPRKVRKRISSLAASILLLQVATLGLLLATHTLVLPDWLLSIFP